MARTYERKTAQARRRDRSTNGGEADASDKFKAYRAMAERTAREQRQFQE